jgi:preprotein translocase subunit SecG
MISLVVIFALLAITVVVSLLLQRNQPDETPAA